MFCPPKYLSDIAVCVIADACTSQVIAFTPIHGSYVSCIWAIMEIRIGSQHVVATISPCRLVLILRSLTRQSIDIQTWPSFHPAALLRSVAFSQ
jgi:hypothetical protein